MDDKGSAFEEWLGRRILEETSEMRKSMEEEPELNDFEPSQELYEKVLKTARDRGLFKDEENSVSQPPSKHKKI